MESSPQTAPGTFRLCSANATRGTLSIVPVSTRLLSEIGFIRVYAVYNDFVFAPLTRPLIWLLRNLSILLENAPVVRTMAGSILLHAQKTPPKKELRRISLFTHESLRGAVSVVIPCHNEEMNVGPLIERILDLYGEYVHEVIPVDDSSTDRTRDVMAALATKDARIKPLYRSPPNGVGRAISDGLQGVNRSLRAHDRLRLPASSAGVPRSF